nr:MDIS1-interacting receptor like kinase 2-like [Tanacetum cinerariifolium]
MGRDTVQLETAVNTISHEYLVDFTSEYGIPETLHLELPGPGDRIVDFPEGKRFVINMCLLEGSLPEYIGMLSNLGQLLLRGNNFNGTLPVSITSLTKLVELDLSGNNFESTIPYQIGNLRNLLHLNLSDNQFSGLILLIQKLGRL